MHKCRFMLYTSYIQQWSVTKPEYVTVDNNLILRADIVRAIRCF